MTRQSDYAALMLLSFFVFVFFSGAAVVSFADAANKEEVATAYDKGFEAGVDSVPAIIRDGPAKQSLVPLYLQTDPQWSSVSYSTGTIESHGCGLVSAAIATSYLTGECITPPRLAFRVRW